MRQYRCIVILVISLVLPQLIFANVRLNGIFSDHMVVQRNTKIPVWGWARPGEHISLQASWGATAVAIAGRDSSWQAELKTPDAGGPFELKVVGDNTFTIQDVLVGEVWLCSGQSNMDFEMYRFVNNAREAKYQPLVDLVRNEVATANDPWIRHIEVTHQTSLNGKIRDFSADWRKAVAGQVDTITAIGYYFAKELRKHLNVPIGLVECAWGGTRIQPWLSEKAYHSNNKMYAYFKDARLKATDRMVEMNAEGFKDTAYINAHAKWIASGKTIRKPYPMKHPLVDEQLPATLHNGMISAIVPFAIRGCLWYQGESNSHFLESEYESYFRLLIESWREEWGQGEFPFYWAQISSYHVPDERSDKGWAMVCDHQRRALSLPHTGMAVLTDIGEAKDVHPHNKMDAGKRLALWALKNEYKIKMPQLSGPLYKDFKIKGHKIIVRFDHSGKGLMVAHKNLIQDPVEVDEALKWFEIAGEDGVWKEAKAHILSHNKIEVYHEDCSKPIKVRYAWSSNPEGANLYNKDCLPASIFTTEE